VGGLQILLLDVSWQELEPEPGRLHLGRLAQALRMLRDMGIQVRLNLRTGSSAWATQAQGLIPPSRHMSYPPRDLRQWALFVQKVLEAAGPLKAVGFEAGLRARHWQGSPGELVRTVEAAASRAQGQRLYALLHWEELKTGLPEVLQVPHQELGLELSGPDALEAAFRHFRAATGRAPDFLLVGASEEGTRNLQLLLEALRLGLQEVCFQGGEDPLEGLRFLLPYLQEAQAVEVVEVPQAKAYRLRTKGGRRLYVVWAQGPRTVSLPWELGPFRVLGAQGREQVLEGPALRVGPKPLLVLPQPRKGIDFLGTP
jgi:hypothetical protein